MRTDAPADVPPVPVRMRDSDAFSWYMERDPLLRSTVVTVAVLDREPDWEALVARVARAVHRLPILRVRLVHPPLRLAPPRWLEVADVDLDWHLQRTRVDGPQAWQSVLDLARRKAVTALDPARPLWELTVVNGLPDGGAALVMVFHHSLTDGIGGVHLAMELFDSERSPGPEDRPVSPDHGEDLGGLRLAWESLGYDAGRLRHVLGVLPRAGLAATAATVRSPRRSVTEALRTARSVWRLVAPVYDTKSPVMRERRLARSFHVLEVPCTTCTEPGAAPAGTSTTPSWQESPAGSVATTSGTTRRSTSCA